MQIVLLKDNYDYVIEVINNYFNQKTDENDLKNKVVFVLKDNEKQIGFIIYSISFEVSDIYFLYINKEYRSKNLGYYLTFNTINYLKEHFNVKEFILEVNINNTKAINLYERLNFKKLRIIKNYYQNNQDAILMKLGEENENISD